MLEDERSRLLLNEILHQAYLLGLLFGSGASTLTDHVALRARLTELLTARPFTTAMFGVAVHNGCKAFGIAATIGTAGVPESPEVRAHNDVATVKDRRGQEWVYSRYAAARRDLIVAMPKQHEFGDGWWESSVTRRIILAQLREAHGVRTHPLPWSFGLSDDLGGVACAYLEGTPVRANAEAVKAWLDKGAAAAVVTPRRIAWVIDSEVVGLLAALRASGVPYA